MKYFFSIFVLILILSVFSSAKDQKKEVNNNKPIIIDVRTQQEFDAGNIAGSKLIPFDVIANKITEVAPSKDTEIILYCRSGRRSGIAQKTLQDMGYKKVENYGSMQAAKDKLGIK